MHKYIHAILFAVIISVSLTPSIGGIGGFILCLASDGHVAIETQHITETCDHVCTVPSAEDEIHRHCERCSHRTCCDIPLGYLALRSNRIRMPNLPALLRVNQSSLIDAWSPDTHCIGGKRTHPFNRFFDSDSRPADLCALRTVILHI